jgi:hypothetical protein
LIAAQETQIPNAPFPALLLPVPIYEDQDGRLHAALEEKRPIYVALIDGFRDNAHYYGARAVIEQTPVDSIRALNDVVNDFKFRYNNDAVLQFGFKNVPWYAIVITEKPTRPQNQAAGEPWAEV